MAIKIHHANSHGNGSMLTVVPVVGEGFIFTLNPQNSEGAAFASFDHEKPASFLVTFAEIGELLGVFRGMQESVRDGKGLYCRGELYASVMKLRHEVEPIHGYRLSVAIKAVGGSDETKTCEILLTTYEAMSLMLAIEGSMGRVFLGV